MSSNKNSTSNPTTTHAPPPLSARPRKPALKIATCGSNPTTPTSAEYSGINRFSKPSSLSLPPSDLSELIAASIRARPSPRRNQPDFFFCSTESNPVAPPSTPVNEQASLDVEEGYFSASTGSSSTGSTPTYDMTPTKRVTFELDRS